MEDELKGQSQTENINFMMRCHRRLGLKRSLSDSRQDERTSRLSTTSIDQQPPCCHANRRTSFQVSLPHRYVALVRGHSNNT